MHDDSRRQNFDLLSYFACEKQQRSLAAPLESGGVVDMTRSATTGITILREKRDLVRSRS